MPVYNHFSLQVTPQGNQINPNVLITTGPIIPVEISIPTALAESFTKSNTPIPQPKSGWVLIDTGATTSCVDDDVITQLGVNPIGRSKIQNSGGEQEVNIFPAHMRFPNIQNFELEFASAIGVNIQAQKVNDQPIIALLGRDILSKCVLVYNGTLGMFTLCLG